MSGYVGSKRSSSLVSATEITLDGAKLKSSGDSITKSDGTTSVLSESGGVVTLNNGTIGSGVVFPAGHIVQSVIPATIGNIDTDAITAQSTPEGFGDVINQITINSGNGVLIYLHVGVQINANINCFGGVLICKGTVSSVGTTLAFDAPGSSETINRVFYTNLWAYDPTPASTSPSYVFAFSKGSVSTASQQIYINNSLSFYCHLYEVQQ